MALRVVVGVGIQVEPDDREAVPLVKRDRVFVAGLRLQNDHPRSGILCGLFGVSALLVAYVSRTAENHSQFRANNCVVFMVENTFRLALYTATGIMTMDVVKNAVCLLPFMAAGLGIGIFFEKHIPERQAKRCVILLLILSGLSLIGTNLAITGA